jgi:hypothetical protein
MGGSAFSSLPDPPCTPRMPPTVYQRVLSECHAALRELFVCVATPIEGPGKKDFGDIDILVALERRVVFPNGQDDSVPRTPHELIAVVQRTLRAKYAIVRGSSANLAIPWPSDMGEHVMIPAEASGNGSATGTDPESKDKYIQVDINICPDVDQLCWVSVACTSEAQKRATLTWLADSLQTCPWRSLESPRKHHSAIWPHGRRGGAVAADTRDRGIRPQEGQGVPQS